MIEASLAPVIFAELVAAAILVWIVADGPNYFSAMPSQTDSLTPSGGGAVSNAPSVATSSKAPSSDLLEPNRLLRHAIRHQGKY